MDQPKFRENVRRSIHLPSETRTIGTHFPGYRLPVFISPNRLRKGKNSKLQHIDGYLDLPAGISCPTKCPDCYAMKAERLYPDSYNHRLVNYFLARDSLPYFLESLFADLAWLGDGSVIRIHSSGDFFSLSYAKGVYQTISKFPDIRFFAFTKSPWAWVPKLPKNLNLIDSTKPFNGLNYTDRPEPYRAFLHRVILPFLRRYLKQER